MIPAWLSAVQRKEARDTLRQEIIRLSNEPPTAPREAIQDELDCLMEPWELERRRQQAQTETAQRVLQSLPPEATQEERAAGADAIRQALAKLPAEAEPFELEAAATRAVHTLKSGINWRELKKSAVRQAQRRLTNEATQQERAKFQAACETILEELPVGTRETELIEALQEEIENANASVKKRTRREERTFFADQGVASVGPYISSLCAQAVLPLKDASNTQLRKRLERCVRQAIMEQFSGTLLDVYAFAENVIDEELGIEEEEDDDA
jgi:hypothetical protein